MTMLASLPGGGIALIVGSGGGIGGSLVRAAETSGRFARVLALSRRSQPALDLEDEASIEAAAGLAASLGDIRLCLVATGLLHGEGRHNSREHGCGQSCVHIDAAAQRRSSRGSRVLW